MKERILYVVTTTKEWFLVPVGRPLRNNSTYLATEKKIFRGELSYRINSCWYNKNSFGTIYEIKETITET